MNQELHPNYFPKCQQSWAYNITLCLQSPFSHCFTKIWMPLYSSQIWFIVTNFMYLHLKLKLVVSLNKIERKKAMYYNLASVSRLQVHLQSNSRNKWSHVWAQVWDYAQIQNLHNQNLARALLLGLLYNMKVMSFLNFFSFLKSYWDLKWEILKY